MKRLDVHAEIALDDALGSGADAPHRALHCQPAPDAVDDGEKRAQKQDIEKSEQRVFPQDIRVEPHGIKKQQERAGDHECDQCEKNQEFCCGKQIPGKPPGSREAIPVHFSTAL